MSAELMPIEDEDERIFAAWKAGKGQRIIAREMGLSQMEVEQAIDRALPALSQLTQSRAYKRQLFLMEDLETEFYAIAKRDKSIDAAHLCVRLNERVCSMNGWSSVNLRVDPIAAQTAEQPTRYQKIHDAIMRLADSGTPAQRAVRKMLNELSPDEALARLTAGNGAALVPADREPIATGTDRERDKGAT